MDEGREIQKKAFLCDVVARLAPGPSLPCAVWPYLKGN